MEITDAQRLRRLEDRVEICELKYRYLRGLDQKDWSLLESCLTDDCVASYSGGGYHFEGRTAIMEFITGAMGAETFLSAHRCGHPEITFDPASPDSASGTWALQDIVVETAWELTIRGAAFYEDTYVRTDDGWKIATTGYKRTYEETQPRSSVEGLNLTASWWGTDGRSSLAG